MIGWLDCSSGASGDMFLGALIGAGVPLSTLQSAVGAVAPEPVALRPEAVLRSGLAATLVRVDAAESAAARSWVDVRRQLLSAELPDQVQERALSVFGRLATAEAAVHGVEPESVHFHEVGALDAIADIVGACAGLVALELEELHAAPVAVGSGTAAAAHGTLPVPAPAVVELLRGLPSYGGQARGPAGDQTGELCTPTGAALLAEWVTSWGDQPPMRVGAVGAGAGSRDRPDRPNVLRLLVGEPLGPVAAEPAQLVLETNVDDLDPRLWPAVLSRLLAAGAADAWLTPILMKKGRPAHTLSVLTRASRLAEVRGVVFAETSAIGVRETSVTKVALARTETEVSVSGRPVRVKVATYLGAVVNVQPEYEDVAAVAEATGRPVKSVLAEAVAGTRELW
jgi:pyridinium-3,5-bisthiocarboxylic acid mononucleotide nickel chelatase